MTAQGEALPSRQPRVCFALDWMAGRTADGFILAKILPPETA